MIPRESVAIACLGKDAADSLERLSETSSSNKAAPHDVMATITSIQERAVSIRGFIAVNMPF
jgi:hypothetical protein